MHNTYQWIESQGNIQSLLVKVDLKDRPRSADKVPSYNHYGIVFPDIIAMIRRESQCTRVGRKLNRRHRHLNVVGTEVSKFTNYFECASKLSDFSNASYKSFMPPSLDAHCIADLNAVGGMICRR